jgi:hypothetical protein
MKSSNGCGTASEKNPLEHFICWRGLSAGRNFIASLLCFFVVPSLGIVCSKMVSDITTDSAIEKRVAAVPR